MGNIIAERIEKLFNKNLLLLECRMLMQNYNHNVQEQNALKPSDPIPSSLIALEGSNVYTYCYTYIRLLSF